MDIHILTLFPEMFQGAFKHSIIGRAQGKKILNINLHNLRDWARDKHKTATPATPRKLGLRGGRVDDTPYGGGAGMVIKVDVVDRALYDLKLQIPKNPSTSPRAGKSQINSNFQISKYKNKNLKLESKSTKVVLLTPKGKVFNQAKAQQLSKTKKLILVCGHYEGFDERIRSLVDEEISIGNYVLTGGEIPAMILVDSISRLIPGVINPKSLEHESFSLLKKLTEANEAKKLKLEYPQYTRPERYQPFSIKTEKTFQVPKILLSGNHTEIKKWRDTNRKIAK